MVETQFADDDASVNRRSAPRGQRAGVQNAPEDITTIGRGIVRAHSRFPGHALTPTGVMAIRCKQFHLPDL